MRTDDIIDGDFFRGLADANVYGSLPDKDIIILYSDACTYERAIMFIQQNPNKKFKLITHNSDRCVDTTFIPSNLIKWYAQNLNFQHHKIEPIPIGLENKKWHPYKREIFDELIPENNGYGYERNVLPLCQLNPNTFPSERNNLINMITSKKIPANHFDAINGSNFSQYAYNLLRHKFCLCPRGNGIDTHRMWEAITLNCIPIIKRHITHEFEEDLPVIVIDDWNDINIKFLDEQSKKINNINFNTKILHKDYWARRITE